MKGLRKKIAGLLERHFKIEQEEAEEIAREILKLTFEHFKMLKVIKSKQKLIANPNKKKNAQPSKKV